MSILRHEKKKSEFEQFFNHCGVENKGKKKRQRLDQISMTFMDGVVHKSWRQWFSPNAKLGTSTIFSVQSLKQWQQNWLTIVYLA